jgi:predicted metal-dependent phosphoesterase TrpH
MTPEDTVRAIREQRGIVLVPHPFDRLRKGSALGKEALVRIIEDVDLIEVFNARTVLRSDNNRAGRFARLYGKPRSAGSDSHSASEIGSVKVEMPEFDGPESFMEAIRQAKFDVRYSSMFVHLRSTWAKLKWRLHLGVAK